MKLSLIALPAFASICLLSSSGAVESQGAGAARPADPPTMKLVAHVLPDRQEALLDVQVDGELPRGTRARVQLWAGVEVWPSGNSLPIVDETVRNLPWQLFPSRTVKTTVGTNASLDMEVRVPFLVTVSMSGKNRQHKFFSIGHVAIDTTGWGFLEEEMIRFRRFEPEDAEKTAAGAPAKKIVQAQPHLKVMFPQPFLTGHGEFSGTSPVLHHDCDLGAPFLSADEKITEIWTWIEGDPLVPEPASGTYLSSDADYYSQPMVGFGDPVYWSVPKNLPANSRMWIHVWLRVENKRVGTLLHQYSLQPQLEISPGEWETSSSLRFRRIGSFPG